MTKYCPKCKKDLNVKNFNKSNRRDGYQTYCRQCHNKMQRDKYNSSPEEKIKRAIRESRRKNRDPFVSRKAELKRLYNLQWDEYVQMFEDQNGVCAICLKECSTKKMLSVDHDHKTGKVRGLLCNGCNTSLGRFEDNVKILQRAIGYLNKN